jgi:hypothetical protein
MASARVGPSGLVKVRVMHTQVHLTPAQTRDLRDQLAAALAEVDENA